MQTMGYHISIYKITHTHIYIYISNGDMKIHIISKYKPQCNETDGEFPVIPCEGTSLGREPRERREPSPDDQFTLVTGWDGLFVSPLFFTLW